MRVDLWSRAAEAMRKDDDPRWHAVADWLRSEAACMSEMENFAEVINCAIEQKSGVKGYIRFGRDKSGEIAWQNDTNEGATAAALAYLGEEPTAAGDERLGGRGDGVGE